MVIFDIDSKKMLKVSLQMELNTLDKKIARVLTARNELYQAICDLFNHDVAVTEGWTADSPPATTAKLIIAEKYSESILKMPGILSSRKIVELFFQECAIEINSIVPAAICCRSPT